MKLLEEACAALAGTIAPSRRLTITLHRVVLDEGHIALLRDPRFSGLLVDPEYARTLQAGSVRWVALLRLPQVGSTLQIERAADTIEEAEMLLVEALKQVLAEEARAQGDDPTVAAAYALSASTDEGGHDHGEGDGSSGPG